MLFNKLALALLSLITVAAALPNPSSVNVDKRGFDDLPVDAELLTDEVLNNLDSDIAGRI